jgi:Icc-related predicted phosphoesterase
MLSKTKKKTKKRTAWSKISQLKLCLFSDIHCRFEYVRGILKSPADFYVAAGDFSRLGECLEKVAGAFQPLGKKLAVIPGNNETASSVKEVCEENGFVFLHGNWIVLGAWTIAGLGYSLPGLDFPGEMPEEDFERMLQPFENIKGKMILVCHSPAAGTIQDSPGRPDLHLGSESIRRFIERRQPEYFFSGHVHQRAGFTDCIGRTSCVGLGPEPHMLEL